MGNPKAFLSINRKETGYRPKDERVNDYLEVEAKLNMGDRYLQASRCMECGVPFCHWSCPLGNRPPEWQDRLSKGDVRGAYQLLSMTNDFPEITGRVCPALCEKSCVLNKVHEAVTVRQNEAAMTELAFEEGYIQPKAPKKRTGKKVAVIGSGPSGMTCAARLNRKGHSVTVYEKDEVPGGLLRLGIPDFKLSKKVVDRRIKLLEAEGVEFKCGVEVGKDIKADDLLKEYDAVCIAIGSGVPRDLRAPGRELQGIHFALDYLKQQNRVNRGEKVKAADRISAAGKHVLVIGGGDTGSDCVGTANRQGALSVTQIEIMPKPPEGENPATPWPYWPQVLKTSSSHEEGCERYWLLDTKECKSKDGKTVDSVVVEEVEWEKDPASGRMNLKHTGKTREIPAQLVLLAMGFTNPVEEGLLEQLGVEKDARKNVKVDSQHRTSVEKVFAVGDASTGASLVVRCMASGRDAAADIDRYLRC